MKQNVRFSGLNLSVDEQAVENGALAVCDGMEVHNGALRPCVIEGEDKAVIDGEILYIHELTTGQKNAIFANSLGELYYKDITKPIEQQEEILLSDDPTLKRDVINSITSNGNTLVLLTTNGMEYFRWYNNTYKYLGDMPELEIEFSLSEGETMISDFEAGSEYTWSDVHDYLTKVSYIMMTKSRYDVDHEVKYYERENLLVREDAMEAALGKAKTICNKAKYFALPFYIRYCYRLWDKRKIMHSAPVLMFSDVTHPEIVAVGYDTETNDHWNFGLLLPQKLHMKVWDENNEVINAIKTDWVDIIKSIDIYITPGISRRNDSITVDIPEGGDYPWEGKFEHLYYYTSDRDNLMNIKSVALTDMNVQRMTLGSKVNQILHIDREGGWGVPGVRTDFRITGRDNSKDYSKAYGIFRPKELGDQQWLRRLVEQNAYYLLKRYDLLEDNTPVTGEVPIDDGILENIEAQEQMITSTAPDDYRTHNKIIAKYAYTYNNRINLTGIQEVLFNGFHIHNLVPENTPGTTGQYITKIVIRLEENGKNIYVQREFENYQGDTSFISRAFVYYPDTRAKEMWIYSFSSFFCHFMLTEHPLLNGAYHIGDLASGELSYVIPSDQNPPASITDEPILDLRNYIFTSASGNPFVYPAAHRYAVGMGEVKAIASTTRALSQGQFGQYPLIAFATDGIYALEVSSTGSYSGIQPISREVITNTNALLQLDQSVAFITKRAISQLIESDVNDLSTQLSGPLRDLSTMLVNLPQTKAVGDLITAVQSSDAIYDFVNKRLLYFLMEDGAYTGDVLTFSANDNAWAFKSLGNVVKGVYNSYPYPYIHKTDGTLICLSEPYDNKDEGNYSGLIVSRTLKSEGYRNAIREFIQDYDIAEARPMLMLWGSDDNRTWHYVGKSNARQMGRLPGRIYKYFRLAVQFENLKRNDLYHGVILDIVERFVR